MMKTGRRKRFLCAVFAVLLTALWSFYAAAEPVGDHPDAQNTTAAQADENAPLFLLLGDSITAAYGIRNPHEASFGRIVADTNHYGYCNLGCTGADSSDMLWLIDGYWKDAIAEADIICMCIGANDYFNQGKQTRRWLVGALFGMYRDELDAAAEQYYENLCAGIAQIRSLNPDAVILMQTLYRVWYGIAGNANRAMNKRVNGMIRKYDREHPGTIHICDLGPAMNGKPRNLADDCVHPNARGNVAIAEVVLQTLYDLGLGTETTPVVNVPGEDWHFFTRYFGEKKGKLYMALAMLATGNGVNVFRLLHM